MKKYRYGAGAALTLLSLTFPISAWALQTENAGALRSIRARHPLHLQASPDNLGPLGSGGGYTPAQIKSVYALDSSSSSGSDGSGQTIAIVVANGSTTLANDVAQFSSQYSLASLDLVTYVLPGTNVGSDDAWAAETTLDVEWAHAIAPGATILLVVCPSDNAADLLQGVQYASANASVVSMSWGSSESSMASFEGSLSKNFAVSGVTFVAAAGDGGYGAQWPSTDPNVLAVGGTTLQLDEFGNRSAEIAWGGSGGGQTLFVASPSQQAWSGSAQREVPDVALDADPNTGYNIYLTSGGINGWAVVGGTSAAAPQWAAFIALVNAQRGAGNPIGPVTSVIYDQAKAATLFTDIVSGCDNSSDTNCAKPGYDTVTGLGVPLSSALVTALASVAAQSPIQAVSNGSGGQAGQASPQADSGSAGADSSSSSGGGCLGSGSGQSSSNFVSLVFPLALMLFLRRWPTTSPA